MSDLSRFLDPLVGAYNRENLLDSDPVGVVHALWDGGTENGEILCFLASALAYGRVSLIRAAVRDVVERTGGNPYSFAESYTSEKGQRAFGDWKYRMNVGEDLMSLFAGFQQVYGEWGTLEAFFAAGDSPDAPTIGPGLESFSERFLSLPNVGVKPARAGLPGVAWFFARPSRGSACKRLNLFLRWVVREPFPDLGLWKTVESSRLVMPVDTHVGRICRYLGLSGQRTTNWRSATAITRELAKLCPEDPVRYDWAISRLGILEECPTRVDPEVCGSCPLVSVCTAGQ